MSARAGLALAAGLAAAAWADGTQHTQYQNALLNRPLSTADQGYCERYAKGNSKLFDGCHITRGFLADIARNADQGFPPDLDINCVQSDTEKNAILDRLSRYGG